MEIIPLGVGGAFAKTLLQTNYYIKPAIGDAFLVDCGQTASRALYDLGLFGDSVTTVVVSHLHADHIGGLEEFGFTGYFKWKKKPVLHVPEPLVNVLWEQSLNAGLGQCLKSADGSYRDARMEDFFNVNSIEDGKPLNIGSVELTPFRTSHTRGRPCWGYRLRETQSGMEVMLTCDSSFGRGNISKYGQQATKIFHDCQLEKDDDHIHALLEELLTLEEEVQKKVILIHYGDNWGDYVGKTGKMEFAKQGESYFF